MIRSEAKQLSLTRYSTGEPCPHGHLCERYTSTGNCVECQLEYKRKWAASKPDFVNASNRSYRKANPQKAKQFREAHYARNKPVFSALSKKRKAHIKTATPPWLSKAHEAEVVAMYQFSQFMSRITGSEYHVDHIVPLRGDLVSGLHAPWNLQVIPATENLFKSNKFSTKESA